MTSERKKDRLMQKNNSKHENRQEVALKVKGKQKKIEIRKLKL